MNELFIPESFFAEEERDGYVVSAKMKKVWACQLRMLKLLQDVCEKHSLKFWLDSGTLLGAVRHKGFIPWDDDIDVVMFRNDYEKLLMIAEREFKAPYIFQTAYNQKDFVRGHAQLRDCRTTAIIPEEVGKSFNQGIFIDIFVLDYVPDDEQEYWNQYWKARNRRKHLEMATGKVEKDLPFKQKALQYYYKTLCLSKSYFNKLYTKYESVFKYNSPQNCSCVSAASWVYFSPKIDADIYNSTIYLDFEMLSCPAPKDYDRLLKIFYGDYMKPVQAPSCHGELILDPDTPSDITIARLRKEMKCKH